MERPPSRSRADKIAVQSGRSPKQSFWRTKGFFVTPVRQGLLSEMNDQQMANLSFQAHLNVQDTEGAYESHRDSKRVQSALSYASQLPSRALPVETRISYLEVCAGMIRPDKVLPSHPDGFNESTFDRLSRISQRTKPRSEALFDEAGIPSRVGTSTPYVSNHQCLRLYLHSKIIQ